MKNILARCVINPYWAAQRILELEAVIDRLQGEKAADESKIFMVKTKLNRWRSQTDSMNKPRCDVIQTARDETMHSCIDTLERILNK